MKRKFLAVYSHTHPARGFGHGNTDVTFDGLIGINTIHTIQRGIQEELPDGTSVVLINLIELEA